MNPYQSPSKKPALVLLNELRELLMFSTLQFLFIKFIRSELYVNRLRARYYIVESNPTF